jgi:hypothetical protein
MDEQSDPGPDVILVEHVIREGWDGPGRIVGYCFDGEEEGRRRALSMQPRGENAVAVRPMSQYRKVWLDTGEPCWNPSVHSTQAKK